ncbi:MAG: glycosyltransferase [Patescibacteria group bacterium]
MIKTTSPCILYVSTFPPRECGIATFTQDLTNAFDNEFFPGIKSKLLAINNDNTTIYNYPSKVVMQINETDIGDYLERAKEINKTRQIKLVNIQHEYGIFGGDGGNYLLPFLELLKKPVVTTFHSVLPKPKIFIKKITQRIINKSSGVVVMTNSASRLLQQEYSVKKSKIFVVPHGVHHIPFPSKTRSKKKLNLSKQTIFSTFGMLNRDKGIEYAIQALPEVIKKYPNVLYLVIGATHPVVRSREGEGYRNKLKKLVIKLGLKDHVKFNNKYLSLGELIEYLKATDIYISPTLNPRQAVSGTLSYALSCACPIISTANQYAKDIVSSERGILARFRNSNDIRNALLQILGDKNMRREMKKNAYFYSRHMIWQNVALSYFNIFNNFAKIVPRKKDELPSINLAHVKTMTNEFGLIQFAIHTKPDIHSGYCLDDNTRALLSCAMCYIIKPSKSVLDLINTYLKFVKSAQKSNGKFFNFINYNKKFIDGESEDSFGRAIWALSYILGNNCLPDNIKKEAKPIFNKAIRWAGELKSSRAIAFTIVGLFYLAEENNEQIKLIKRLANKLVRRYKATNKADNKWLWFENYLTYSNYKLPEALILAYKATKYKEYLQIAEKTLKFVNDITFEKGNYFSPIGQDGWYFRDGKRAYFDQQPEDTASAVEALAVAYQVTKKEMYAVQAKLAYEWFLGKNHLSQMVYDEVSGGCYDGLGKYSLNFNQGAESTISYLLARLAMDKIK